MSGKRVLSQQELIALADTVRREGKQVVLTNGCFDLLHVGHVRYLEAAKALGDVLLVGVNSDHSTKFLKGDDRPIVPEQDRADMVAALACVDGVCIFPEPTAENLVRLIRPHVYAKGGDYRDPDGGLSRLPEAKPAVELGGRVELLPMSEDRSTTALLRRIKDSLRSRP